MLLESLARESKKQSTAGEKYKFRREFSLANVFQPYIRCFIKCILCLNRTGYTLPNQPAPEAASSLIFFNTFDVVSICFSVSAVPIYVSNIVLLYITTLY
jgi:hypothetical protein